MKVVKTFKGYEVWKLSKAAIKKMIPLELDVLINTPANKAEAVEQLRAFKTDSDLEGCSFFKEPKMAKITIIYELEE